MLFSFNEEFIAATCGGLNDDETLDLFAEGVQAMIDRAEESLDRIVDRDIEILIEGDELVIPVTEHEMRMEYGDDSVQMNPQFRQGLIQAQNPGRRAFDKVVNDLG